MDFWEAPADTGSDRPSDLMPVDGSTFAPEHTMSHLSADQRDALRRELARQLRRLEGSMEITDEALQPVELDQAAVGRLSRIDSLQNQGLTRNLREREQLKLARIQEAFRALEDGSYGTCRGCEAQIPFGRLLVFPETGTCAECGGG